MGLARGDRRLTLVGACLAQGMILLDVTIVNVALPSIQHDLHTTTGSLEWVISAYALALATLIPLGGAIGDRFGRKRFFLAGIVVFTLASALCAVSTVDVELIAFRVLQGVGGALMSALTLSILVEAYPAERRAGAIGVWASAAGIGFGMGPVVGGLLLGLFPWSSIFWVNVPIGATALVIGILGVRESRDPRSRRLDPLGVVLSAGGLFLLTFGLTETNAQGWTAPVVVGCLLGGVTLLALFAWWEHRARSPMVPPPLVRQRVFAAANGIYFTAYVALTGMFFFVTLLFQDLFGWSALRTGLSWLPMNIPFLVVAQFAGRLADRFSRVAIVTVGCILGGAGVAGLGQIGVTTPYWMVAVAYALLGLGYGLFIPACSAAAMAHVPEGTSGIASGVLNTSRQVGSSVGLAVLGALGVSVVRSAWHANLASLSPATQAKASGLTTQVAGAGIDGIRHSLGPAAAQAATSAFLSGYRVALTVGGIAVLLGAVLAATGMRVRRAPAAAPVATATEVA